MKTDLGNRTLACRRLVRTAKFIIFNTQFLVLNTQFLVLNTKLIIFTHICHEEPEDDEAETVAVLEKYFDIPTKLEYSDTSTGPLQAKVIVSHSVLVRSLKSVQDNLSFAPVFLTNCCRKVAKHKQLEWKFKTNEVEDFATGISNIIRV